MLSALVALAVLQTAFQVVAAGLPVLQTAVLVAMEPAATPAAAAAVVVVAVLRIVVQEASGVMADSPAAVVVLVVVARQLAVPVELEDSDKCGS